ncbi:hypothetical protein MMC20_003638 [Loxospora ochrophaea]|nr:hypothetical protein [Loxospora ochrophaea]
MDEGSRLFVDRDTGRIVDEPLSTIPYEVRDLKGLILAPAFLELQTNGCAGVHFTVFEDASTYHENLRMVSKYLATTGVGAFLATIPTVSSDVFSKVLPQLSPQSFSGGAHLLGAHCEGPWLNPLKKGAHDASLMKIPVHTSVVGVYGNSANLQNIKMVTIAPELEGSSPLINDLVKSHDMVVSLGHSAADYDAGIAGLKAGA